MSTTMERPGCSSDSGNRQQQQQPSRLQKRPPALKIVPAPANDWNTAIPLLSPLALSPESPTVENQTKAVAAEKTVTVEKTQTQTQTPIFKTWKHPAAAAPFCYEPSTFVPPFVPV